MNADPEETAQQSRQQRPPPTIRRIRRHARRSVGDGVMALISVTTPALVIDHLAQQGWGKLANGTIIWEDDHRVTPGDAGSGTRKTAAS